MEYAKSQFSNFAPPRNHPIDPFFHVGLGIEHRKSFMVFRCKCQTFETRILKKFHPFFRR